MHELSSFCRSCRHMVPTLARRAAVAEPLGYDTAARCRGRSLHPVRSFQVAVAARIERQQICNLWWHHPEGRRQDISSLCTAREFCLRSFGPADRRPSACSNLPPLPRQLLRSRIRLSASSWISGRMALAESSPSLWQSYLRFEKTVIFVFKLSSFST